MSLSNETEYDVIIVGGGLAGLISAIQLSRAKKRVLLIEKKNYPYHKVCGEYVSNEVLSFLKSIGFDPFTYGASKITKLRISKPNGQSIYSKLDLGGFGLSRFVMDKALMDLGIKMGAHIICGESVLNIFFHENKFTVELNSAKSFTTSLVIGSYGKRALLDKKLNRNFIQHQTGYMGVKYHIELDYPIDEVGLDNFEGGYCGIVKIEENKYNLCYLYKRNKDQKFNSIKELEETVLYKNPFLKNFFISSKFIFPEPEVINEISFEKKTLIENHIMMCGDSAGLITPLCGNGMAIAIHSAKLLSELILSSDFLKNENNSLVNRLNLERSYQKIWEQEFSKRLFWGRTIQQVFGKALVTTIGINCLHAIPPLEKWLIGKTHGTVI